MIVQNCSFTVHFPQNVTIRESLFNLEKHFSDFQKPFTLVPLPPEAPIEIPRIIATTKGGHSQLLLTGSSIQLTTNFDSNFNLDVAKCIEYVKSKCTSIISSLPIIGAEVEGKPKFYFSGLSASFLFTEEDGIQSSIDYISSKFLKCDSNLKKDEVQFRIAFVLENKYYVNIVAQNYREFTNGPDERGSFVNLGLKKEGLQIIIDINDRFAFNHEKEYLSSEDTANTIVYLAEQFAKEHVKHFVEEGEVKYAIE